MSTNIEVFLLAISLEAQLRKYTLLQDCAGRHESRDDRVGVIIFAGDEYH